MGVDEPLKLKSPEHSGPKQRRPEAGLSLLEVMLAAFLLTVGLLAAALTVGTAVGSMFISQEQLIAKQKAREALESVFTARNTQNIVYNQIRNVSDATVFNPPVAGIFVDGWQPITLTGSDGIANTADDAGEPLETTTLPGPDGLLGTLDDEVRPLTTYQRRIEITNITMSNGNPDPDIRQITVEVRFSVKGVWRTVTLGSRISRFS